MYKMNYSNDAFVEYKMENLQEKLKTEDEIKQSRNVTINTLCNPMHGSGSSGNRSSIRLGDIGTPTRTRKQLNLPVSALMQSRVQDTEVDSKMKEIMKINGILYINGKKYYTDIKDLEQLGELGNGTCGHVVKMLHKPSNTIIAVKQMRRSGNSDENKRIIMDLDVVFKSHDCPYIVRYLGCFITESDVWICMELMGTCFDRLLKKLKVAVPEDILGKVALATVKALHYLKESHDVIHRDVKPSNILLDEKGNVKLCDFGISGRLVDSKARTKNAGCAAYMAPERIEPPDPRKPDYDIRADVWSLGITLVELAIGAFPYKDCKCDFEVLSRVLNEDPPSLPPDPNRFTLEFQSFVSSCLTKDYSQRPKYRKLLEHPFLKRYETKQVDIAAWYARVVSGSSISSTPFRFISTPLTMSTRQQPPPPPPSTHRSRRATGLENKFFNDGQSSQCSSFHSPESQYGVNGLHSNEWDSQKYKPNKYSELQSPLLRRLYPTDSSHNSSNGIYSHIYSPENTSPLVLQRFHHQQSQQYNYQSPSYRGPSSRYRSASSSPSRRYLTESSILSHDLRSPLLPEYSVHDGQKPICSSYWKYQMNHNVMDDVYRRSPPTVPSPAPPSPPPRLNRVFSQGSSLSNVSLSPLMTNRTSYNNPESSLGSYPTYFENSPVLPRRQISACPPQPPPRRLSESGSVPGSHEHFNFRKNDFIRNTPAPSKFLFTPQPQRKKFYQINDL